MFHLIYKDIFTIRILTLLFPAGIETRVLDVTNTEDVKAFAATIERVDILFNVAGYFKFILTLLALDCYQIISPSFYTVI